MRRVSGIKLLAETEGVGAPAARGDRIVYNCRIFLNGGDEVPLNERQAAYIPADRLRTENGCRFVDHETTVGKRQSIAAVQYALEGMKPGGYRKIRVSPHLAYRDEGLPGLIPADAVLIVEIWLRERRGDQE